LKRRFGAESCGIQAAPDFEFGDGANFKERAILRFRPPLNSRKRGFWTWRGRQFQRLPDLE